MSCMPSGLTERIWTEFRAPLRRFIVSRVPDAHAADDILQNVFLKVHKSIGSLRDDGKIEPWLFQIAKNAITDHYRRRPTEYLDPSLDLAMPCEAGGAEQSLAVDLGARIDRLPEGYRAAVVLSEIEGLSQAEVACRLRLSLSGGKSRIQRGREMLKRGLLECCRIELDRYGRVISYEQRSPSPDRG